MAEESCGSAELGPLRAAACRHAVGYSLTAFIRSSAQFDTQLGTGECSMSIPTISVKRPPQRSRIDPLAGEIPDEATVRVDEMMLTAELAGSGAIGAA